MVEILQFSPRNVRLIVVNAERSQHLRARIKTLGNSPESFIAEATDQEAFELLFERVLTALVDAKGDETAFKTNLKETVAHHRAITVIRALLMAETALSENFRDEPGTISGPALARNMALHLCELTELAQQQMPKPQFSRIRDLSF